MLSSLTTSKGFNQSLKSKDAKMLRLKSTLKWLLHSAFDLTQNLIKHKFILRVCSNFNVVNIFGVFQLFLIWAYTYKTFTYMSQRTYETVDIYKKIHLLLILSLGIWSMRLNWNYLWEAFQVFHWILLYVKYFRL